MEHLVKSFYASGKLMLFGEYVVMRGVSALAFPTRFGQELHVKSSDVFSWTSSENGSIWFRMEFDLDLRITQTNNLSVAQKALEILQDIRNQKPNLFLEPLSFNIQASFNRSWGLGTSATLISLLAQWSCVDAFELNDKHFGGSAYDIACATANGAILYDRESRTTKPVSLPESITDYLLFVYSGKKQDSNAEVVRFGEKDVQRQVLVKLKQLVLQVTEINSIDEFEAIITQHETLISEILGVLPIKKASFADYPYAVKSLGAWGGDFFMVSYREISEAKNYFMNLGYESMFTFEELRKNDKRI